MRSPLVTPTRAASGRYCKTQPASTSKNLARQSKSRSRFSGSGKLSGILKKATFPSKGKTVADPSIVEGKAKIYRTTSFMPQMDPLLTPSPRRSPRIATLNVSSPLEDYSLSPLIHPDLFSRDVCRETSSLACGRSNVISPVDRSYSKWPHDLSDDTMPAEGSSWNESHTSVRDYMKSGRPFPADEHERHLKILVRTGIRDLNDLAKELNSKATISSTLTESNIPENAHVSKKTLKRSKSSSDKVNYSEVAIENGKPKIAEKDIAGKAGKSRRKLYRTICSATALPNANACPNDETSTVSISTLGTLGENRVLKKKLFNNNRETEIPVMKFETIGNPDDAKVDGSVPRREGKEKKIWKRLSWNVEKENTTNSSKVFKNFKGRSSLDSKYSTLGDIDTENEIPKNCDPKLQGRTSGQKCTEKNHNIPRRIFKVLFDN